MDVNNNNNVKSDVDIEDNIFYHQPRRRQLPLPPPSPDIERAYQAKMDLLQQIHSEVFPPPPVGEEYAGQDMYDTRYYHEHNVACSL